MKNRWNESDAAPLAGDPLKLRVHTSRLLGIDPDLVMHGGGNTSVKAKVVNHFGETEEILFVKGSGWDLATIEPAGFAPVRLETLRRMAALETLPDVDMVRLQRAAMTDPNAPTPSVEALLHAIIPFAFVDHTHADAVVTISNTPDGQKRLREIYGGRVLIVPYVMPGFILAKKVYEMTRRADWSKWEGMILLNHGVFTFADDARESYDRMIRLVAAAEEYLKSHDAWTMSIGESAVTLLPPETIARIRREVSRARGSALLARWDDSPEANAFALPPNVSDIASRGPLTPDHVIRAKRTPMIVSGAPEESVRRFEQREKEYFEKHRTPALRPLDPAPRWAVIPGAGALLFGATVEEVGIVGDIAAHTMTAIRRAERLGGWHPLPEKEIFDVEYWELEQAKLKKGGAPPPFRGRVAVVTGAAGGIGRACAEALAAQGAAVAALDIDSKIGELFKNPSILGLRCDVTSREEIARAVETTVRRFGGVDILVANAGLFPATEEIADVTNGSWKKSLDVNLTGNLNILQECIPFLKEGIEPSVVVVASKNVPAPGPGAAAYSVAKAGLTQLSRVAALELAPHGIRVNVIHPHGVFDTGIWTPEVLESRAAKYGMTVEEYKTNNLLKTGIASKDVAALVVALAGPAFAKTTGAQIPIDGGNDRVI